MQTGYKFFYEIDGSFMLSQGMHHVTYLAYTNTITLKTFKGVPTSLV